MAGGTFDSSGGDDGINEINMIPFVDIVLVLLIIFMVTAEFLREEPKEPPPGIEVELPSAASAGEMNESLLSIVINKKGELFLNGEVSSKEAIRSFVENSPKPAKELEALISADRDIAHGDVVSVVDSLRLLGVERFGINTKPQDIE